ncbi:MAG: VOC family protein [Jatrophihabitans sp.]
MFDHIGIEVGDVEAALDFYLTVFASLGLQQALRFDSPTGPVVGLAGPDGRPQFWLSPASVPAGREDHLAFTAADRATVEAVHRAAVAAGAEILHEPRVFPEYHPDYYGVFVRDLDGNNVEAVCHRPD